MKSIGYFPELIKRDYKFAVYAGEKPELRSASIAAFAQEPTDYRNACIGVIGSNGNSSELNINNHLLLGAPLFFELTNRDVALWKIENNSAKFMKRIGFDKIENVFMRNKDDWLPRRILEAKRSYEKQLDFVDAGYMTFLEGILRKKLGEILEKSISDIKSTFKEFNQADLQKKLFRLIFYFIAVKVFRDREFSDEWTSDDPKELLELINRHYGDIIDTTYSDIQVKKAWENISFLRFQNLSIEDLYYIYENTFVDKETRKLLGIHSTPSFIAEYILNKLPIENIPEENRYILEPFSGGGVFLIAAIRRLRELLSEDMDVTERHEYFRNRIVGIEIDNFAVEVSKLCLMLADYPNKNNWKIDNEDTFNDNILMNNLKLSNIVVTNPPFEEFKDEEKNKYSENCKNIKHNKPAEFLKRLFTNPPECLGIILPMSSLHKRTYKGFRNDLLRTYRDIEYVILPEQTFSFSDVETVALTASNKKYGNERSRVTAIKVNSTHIKERFSNINEIKTLTKEFDLSAVGDSKCSIWLQENYQIWDYLSDYPKLSEAGEFHQGINLLSEDKLNIMNRSIDELFSDEKISGFKKGYKGDKGLKQQFYLSESPMYISCRLEDNFNKNYKFNWDTPKVICNTVRLSRGPWRLAASIDLNGFVFTKRFFAIWQSGDYSLYEILAILNSPMANAYLHEHDDKDNRIETLKNIPIPPIEAVKSLKIEELTENLLKIIEQSVHQDNINIKSDEFFDNLLKLDSDLLRAYDLPPRYERQLLEIFRNASRPLPIDINFRGYYPKEMDAAIPLYMLLAKEFKDSTVDKVKERLVKIDDSEISEMFSWLNEEE